ncbi:MAG: hypothetical protein LBH38_01075 [Holosporales bacterium]|nr:hypothetical protein [Holosporales bacterium]
MQLVLNLQQERDFRWQGFAQGATNQEALSWLKNWPYWPTYGVVIYGPACSGKTHLGRLWQEGSGAHLLKPQDQNTPPLALASLPILIDGFSDMPWDEDWLFHFLNARFNTQARILILDRAPPCAWPVKKPDVRSRCLVLPSVGIHAPDETFIEAFLIALFRERGVTLSQGVARFLSIRLERCYATILQMVEHLNACSLRLSRPITVPFLKEIGGIEG